MTSKTQTEEYLRKTQLPLATESYTVIPHGLIIDTVRKALNEKGFTIKSELYKAEYQGDIALGFMEIENSIDPDMAMTFNWTNSYNKMVKFNCSIGGFIYDNAVPFICKDSQASWIRKHTGTALDEALQVIDQMVLAAEDHFSNIIEMKDKFKATPINRKEYAKLMGLLYFDKMIITSEQINVIKREYDKPSFQYSDPDTLWGVYKKIMHGIINQAPKLWYKQQIDINTYISVLFSNAAISIGDEEAGDDVEVDTVEDVVEILDLFVEQEDTVMKKIFTPILPCIGHAVESEKSEMKSVDNLIQAQNLIQDAKSVRTTESLFDDIDSKKERLEEIRTELDEQTVSYGELAELQELVEYIEEDDVQLLEAAGVPEFIEEETIFVDERAEETFAFPNLVEDIILPTVMSEDAIEMIKEEHGVVDKEEVIIPIDENIENMFEIIADYDEELDNVPWFTQETTVVKEPSLIPDSMTEAVEEILKLQYTNNQRIVDTEELEDLIIFQLNTEEFFVVEK